MKEVYTVPRLSAFCAGLKALQVEEPLSSRCMLNMVNLVTCVDRPVVRAFKRTGLLNMYWAQWVEETKIKTSEKKLRIFDFKKPK